MMLAAGKSANSRIDYGYLTQVLDMVMSQPFLQTRPLNELKKIIQEAREKGQNKSEPESEAEVTKTLEAYLEMAHVFMCQDKVDKLDRMLEIVAKSLTLFHTTDSYPKIIYIKYSLLKKLSEKTYESTRLAVFKEMLAKTQDLDEYGPLTCILHMIVCLLHIKVHKEISYNDTSSSSLFFQKRLKLSGKLPKDFKGLDLVIIQKRFKLKYEPYLELVYLSIAVSFHLDCLSQYQTDTLKPDAIAMASKCLFYISNLNYQYQTLLKLPTEALLEVFKQKSSNKPTQSKLDDKRKKYQMRFKNRQSKTAPKAHPNGLLGVSESVAGGKDTIQANDLGGDATNKVGTLIILNNNSDKFASKVYIRRKDGEEQGLNDQSRHRSANVSEGQAKVVVNPKLLKKHQSDKRVKTMTSQHVSIDSFGFKRWVASPTLQKRVSHSALNDKDKDTSKDKYDESLNDSRRAATQINWRKPNLARSMSNIDEMDIIKITYETPKSRYLQRNPSNDGEASGNKLAIPSKNHLDKKYQNNLKNILGQNQSSNQAMMLEVQMRERPSIEEGGSLTKTSFRNFNPELGNSAKRIVLHKVVSEKSINNADLEAGDMNYFFGNLVSRRPSFIMSSRPSQDSTRITWLHNTDRRPPSIMKDYLNNPLGINEAAIHKRKILNFEKKKKIHNQSIKLAQLNLERWGWSKPKENGFQASYHKGALQYNSGLNRADQADLDPIKVKSREYGNENSIYDGELENPTFPFVNTLEEEEIEQLKGLFNEIDERAISNLQSKKNPAKSKRLLMKALRLIKEVNQAHSNQNQLARDNTANAFSPNFLEPIMMRNRRKSIRSGNPSSGTNENLPIEPESPGIRRVRANGNNLDLQEGSYRHHSIENGNISGPLTPNSLQKTSSIKIPEDTDRGVRNEIGRNKSIHTTSKFAKNAQDKEGTPNEIHDSPHLNDGRQTPSDTSRSKQRKRSISRTLKENRLSSKVARKPEQTVNEEIVQRIKLRNNKKQLLTSKLVPIFDDRWRKLVRNRYAKCLFVLRMATSEPNAV